MNASSQLDPFNTFAWIVCSAVWPCFCNWMWMPWWLKKCWSEASRLFASRTSAGTWRWKASIWLEIGWASRKQTPATTTSSPR